MHFRRTAIASISAVAILSTAALLTAGPLDPPSGAIASSYKTLSEVEPRTPITLANAPGDADSVFRISKPGSYYLTESMTAPAGKSAIEIAASNVTIDLNGFTLTSLSNLAVIRLSIADRINISIRNGHIGACAGPGIDILPTGVSGARTIGGVVSNVTIVNTNGAGLRCGDRVIIENCTASGTGGNGIETGNYCQISNSIASDNNGSGFQLGSGATVESCVSYRNALVGFVSTGGPTFNNCNASDNGNRGFTVSQGTLSNCVANNNGTVGFYLNGSSIVNSTAAYNTENGITLLTGTATSCIVQENDGKGISATGATITDCTARENGTDGFSSSAHTHFRGNSAMNNLGAGILISGSLNRLEGNTCGDNQYGIRVTGTRNIITRNTCAGNSTNWSIGIGNSFSQILLAGVNSTAVNGNTAPSTISATDPNANATY